jgi:hypothetical protein
MQMSLGLMTKKSKVATKVAAVFRDDSDEEAQ